MNHLDPAWLASFVAIADTGALVRAAERIHRTPSALSVQLRQLEASLQVQLVMRSTRRLQLTAEGERFLPYAQRLLDLQEEAWQAVRPPEPRAPWRIGLSEYFQPARLKLLLALLEGHAQGASLDVSWTRSAEVLRAWSDKTIDLAVFTADKAPPGARLLHREPLCWVAAPGWHPPSTQPLPLVLLSDSCPVRSVALNSLKRRGIAHSVRMECSGSQAVVTALRGGWGVGCLNLSAVPPDLEILAEQAPRRWPSPGRLTFHTLATAELSEVATHLRAWLR